MSKNYMEEVARMLGVELGENFDVNDGVCNPYTITEQCMFDCDGDDCPFTLLRLLNGRSNIIKKPWIPKDGESVFYIDIEGNGEVWEDEFCSDDLYSIGNLTLGWVFKTREEAEAHKEEIMRQKERILKGELRAELVEVE